MSRRRIRRRIEKAQRHAVPSAPASAAPPSDAVRVADEVRRLVYTRSQAAEALAISRTTFDRRVLPYIEIVETPWGTELIPVDELERLVRERRRAARRTKSTATPGRRRAVAADVVERIRAARAAGKSLAEIARELNHDAIPTAQGGRQWWPSTVRAVLRGRPA